MSMALPPRGTADSRGRAARRCDQSAPAPLVWPVAGVLVGIVLSGWADWPGVGTQTFMLSLPALAGVALLGLYRKRPGRFGVVAGLLVALVGLGVGYTRHQVATWRPADHVGHVLADEPVLTRVAGVVVTRPVERAGERRNPFLAYDPPARTQFVLKLESLCTGHSPRRINGRVRVSVEATGLGLRGGERVELTGRLYAPRGPMNPGEIDWSAWYRRQGLAGGMSVEAADLVRVLERAPTLLADVVGRLRLAAERLLLEPHADVATDETTRLLDVMVLGQRSMADRALNEAFLRSGGMHFLAVSGFHVGVLALIVWQLARRLLRRSRRVAGVATIIATLLYALVAEPNAPILRATTMVVLGALASMSNRPVSVLNWLSLAAGCVVLIDPLEVFRAGFQLSFVEVLALVLLVPPAWRWLARRRGDDEQPSEAGNLMELLWLKLWRWLGGLALACVVAYVAALPLVLFHFQRVSPWGWLGTFVISPAVVVVIVLSLAALLVGVVIPAAGALLAGAAQGASGLLLRLVGLFGTLPAAVVEVTAPAGWLVVATYVVLLGPTLFVKLGGAYWRVSIEGRWAARVVVVGLLAVGWVGWLVLPTEPRGTGHTLHVLAVGNASCAYLTTPDNQTQVFDVGTDTNSDVGRTLVAALRVGHIGNVQRVWISHPNFDHYSGLATLLRDRRVDSWLVNADFLARADDYAVSGLLGLVPGDAPRPTVVQAPRQSAADGAQIDVLWPPTVGVGELGANDQSLVLRLSVDGWRILLPGDIELAAQAALLAQQAAGVVDLRADVLIAPHHGAVEKGVTEAFYQAVEPRVVVVSARTDRPRLAELVGRVLPEARLYMTGDCGAVTVRVMPAGALVIRTVRGAGGCNECRIRQPRLYK